MSARRKPKSPLRLSQMQARHIWIDAQRLNTFEPFGDGPDAVQRAVQHLGYVQIDTINVIERCHHHILYNRIPAYRREDLATAQSEAKTVFEYWTHALSLVPVRDFAFFVAVMKAHRINPTGWSARVDPAELQRVLNRVKKEGPLTISDFTTEKLVDKTHPWASRKPSKQALQAAFYNGQMTIARRDGMLKTYELTERHFGWQHLPKPATERQITQYILQRALTAQGIVSLDSICHLSPKSKPAVAALIEKHIRAKRLVRVEVEGAEKTAHWIAPETLEKDIQPPSLTHILSPFDPLIILRKRTSAFFDYDHLFEAYVPAAKRKLGYFTLPVLLDAEIVAAIDLKADRAANKLRIQNWHWMGKGNKDDHQSRIELELARFERFQLARSEDCNT